MYIGCIPVRIQPLFWVFAALIGYINSQTVIGTLIWIGIIVLSVLFHEFGHALTALFFGQKPEIQLVALGGLTSYRGDKVNFFKQFLIVLNGPLAGILLFGIASLIYRLPLPAYLHEIVGLIRFVNLFWSIINLLPVLPLDGGQLLRIALEGFFGVKGLKASLLIGMIIALLISIYFFIVQAFLPGAFFFLFAFQSFDLWRKSHKLSPLDREDSFKIRLSEAEKLIEQDKKAEAEPILTKIISDASGGLLAAEASEMLSIIYADQGKRKEAYALLLPNQDELSDGGLCLLYQLSYEMGNFDLVCELSASCYQLMPTQDVALHNARAFAAKQHSREAGGWLQTAWRHKHFDLPAFIQDAIFDPIRNDPEFHQFIDVLYRT